MHTDSSWIHRSDWSNHPILRSIGATEDVDGAHHLFASQTIADVAHRIEIQVRSGPSATWRDVEPTRATRLVWAGHGSALAWPIEVQFMELGDLRARVREEATAP